MRRDFSDEYKQKLIRMIQENDEEKWCDFTDWIGDRLLDFGEWTGALNLVKYLGGVDSYTKKILDKNNTSIDTINKIFRDVYAEDDTCANRINTTFDMNIANYRNILLLMQSTISPEGSGFTVEQIQNLIGLANNLNDDLNKIEYDVSFSEDVYDIVFDENGKRKDVGDISDADKNRVIEAYEDAHPEWKEELDKLLKSGNPNTLTEEDIRNIKFIAYTADEPYRSIYLDNVKEYKIGTIGNPKNEGAYYWDVTGKIYFENNISGFSGDPRGPYTTFFHESGHATDYKEGDPFTKDFTYYSEEMGRDVSLQEAIYYDVYNNIENQIRECGVEDEESVNRILDAFRYGNDTSGLSEMEIVYYNEVVSYYYNDLSGEVNEAACDVYGGVTNLKIGQNGYGHRPDDGNIDNYYYWYNSSGNATGAQSRELWAEYFSYCMTGDEEALESLRMHFPEACKVLDAIAEQMGKNVGK